MSNKNTIFVNLIAGPGAGKSTTASKVFSYLKDAGVDCELVREWVKESVWEDNQCVLSDEVLIFAEQNHLQHRLKGKVDVVITEAPLFLKMYYQPEEYNFRSLIKHVMDEYNNMNFFLKRIKEFKSTGRMQTESQAKVIDAKLLELLDAFNMDYIPMTGNTVGAQAIAQLVIQQLEKQHKAE